MYHLAILPALSLVLLSSTSVFAIPFYAAEECSCETLNPAGSSNASLAECQRIASHLQTMRMRARNMPYLADIWLTSSEVLHVNVRPEQRHAARTIASKPGRQPAREKDIGHQPTHSKVGCSTDSKIAKPEHSVTIPPARKAQHILSVAEQLALRHPPSSLHPSRPSQSSLSAPQFQEDDHRVEKYNILCRAKPHHSPSVSSNLLHISVRPLPFLFVFLSVVLACTTIIDWAVELWLRGASEEPVGAEIRLEGEERRIWAVALAGDVDGRESEDEKDKE